MKISLASLKRTNIGFPTEYEGVTENDTAVYLHFRYGKLDIKESEQGTDPRQGKLVFSQYKDEFCLDGVISKEDLEKMLSEHSLTS